MRPVYHGQDERVRAHLLVAALAFLLDRALEKKLRAAKSSLSSPAAWRALETVRLVEVEAGKRRRLCVTRGSRQAGAVLRTVGLTPSELNPPTPPSDPARGPGNPPVVTKTETRPCVFNNFPAQKGKHGLGGGKMPPIHETDYDNFFVVTVYTRGKAKVVRLRYGDPT